MSEAHADGLDEDGQPVCPNCGERGGDEYETGSENREFQCDNSDCLCMVFRTAYGTLRRDSNGE